MKTLRMVRGLWGMVMLCLLAGCGAPLVVPGANAPTPRPTAEPIRLVTPTAPPTAVVDVAATRAAAPPVTLAGSLPLVTWDPDEDRNTLVPVHPLTGEPLAGYDPIDLGFGFSSAFSTDGRTLAIASFAHEDPSFGGEVVLVDLTTWTVHDTGIEVDDYPVVFQFTPDDQNLLIVEARLGAGRVRRVALANVKDTARAELEFLPSSLAVTPDGRKLLVFGAQGQFKNGLNPIAWAARLDLDNLTPEWTQALEGVLDGQFVPEGVTLEAAVDESIWYGPGYAWSPEGARLYLVHADADRLTTVDFAAETVATVNVAPAQSWLDRLMALTADVVEAKMLNGTLKQAVLSPDGERLYVVGYQTEYSDDGYRETALGLSVIETATGALLSHTDTEARSVSLSAEGAQLWLEVWGQENYAEIRPADNVGQVIGTLPGVYLHRGRLPSGELVLLGAADHPTESEFQVLDPGTLAVLSRWTTQGYGYPLLAP